MQKQIGEMIKRIIHGRNKTIKETAAELNIGYTTFSAQLQNDTMTVDTMFRLAAYLDIDLNWFSMALGYFGTVNPLEREMIPRMQSIFREKVKKEVLKNLDLYINQCSGNTSEIRKELLNQYNHNVFYLLDVLIPDDYEILMSSERDKPVFSVKNIDFSINRTGFPGRRTGVGILMSSTEALNSVIEDRKEGL